MRIRLGILALLTLSLTVTGASTRRSIGADAPGADAQALEFFETKVRPLLVDRCLECHGASKPKSGLRVDSREALIKGGLLGPALEPGKPEESLLIDAVRYGDLVQMPPKSKLSTAEIEILTRWVALGAPWPKGETPGPDSANEAAGIDLKARAEHWSFQPIQHPSPPQVRDQTWPSTDLDRFVLSKLEDRGLEPAPEADPRLLIRRLTYDLTGLPPTPSEIHDFLNDSSPDAYEKLVDRLLASPRFGERWGRHWLDLVRFAETSGHEFDYDILDAWRYRDYITRAFNADVPFDRLIVEHIAGDLVPEPRRRPDNGENESVLGTGFFFLGEGTHSPVDVREDEAFRIDNQLDVLGKTFLGLTIACARCHDHKFDPIRQKDYYALAGYLQSSRHQHAFLDHPARIGQPVRELDALRKAIDLEGAARVDLSLLKDYLSSAFELAGGVGGADVGEGDILFADFEGPTYDGWIPSGSAFGETPLRLPVPAYQGVVECRGLGLVGSHNGRVSGSVEDRDSLVGTLTSPRFRIERDYIGFLIGGGAHAGRTCVNLEIDGRVVLSATGENANPMRWKHFDTRPFRGQSARLVVVDQEKGGWGNISLDHVVFSDQPSPPWTSLRAAEALALDRGLDPALLSRWLDVLKDHPKRLPEPLTALVSEPTPEPENPNTSVVFERFDGPDFTPWTTTGPAFGTGPSQPGDWRPSDHGPVPVEPGQAHSGLVSNHLLGVLRSPTFTIERPFVLFRARGREGRLNLVVDGFEKIRSPIYGGLTISVNSDDWRWYVMNVSMWNGHRAYIEAGDGATADYTGGQTRYAPGDGYLAIDEVRFSLDARTPEGPHPVDRPQEGALVHSVASTLEAWKSGQRDLGGRVEAIGWLIEHGLLATSPDPRMRTYREIEARIPEPNLGLAILDGSPEDEYVFLRGNYRTPGDRVPRRFLEVLGGESLPESTPGSGRLDLAHRIADPSNPLPARVMANRVWLHLLGRGIVPTPDDFGLMGTPPTHPELLDWLAAELIENDWSIKRLIRMIVLSRTYRMSSRLDPEAESADPDNSLWHRARVRRLEAETIRDAMLAVSGRLDPTPFGPSVPPHLTPFMEGRGRPSQSGPLDGKGRRSLYLCVRRNFLTPMLLVFDFPTPASSMGRRNVSNVPAQALTLMNDPSVLHLARLWSDRVLSNPSKSASERIDTMYLSAFGRLPEESERAQALAFLGPSAQTRDPGPWADLAHVLFNVKEFIFLY